MMLGAEHAACATRGILGRPRDILTGFCPSYSLIVLGVYPLVHRPFALFRCASGTVCTITVRMTSDVTFDV